MSNTNFPNIYYLTNLAYAILAGADVDEVGYVNDLMPPLVSISMEQKKAYTGKFVKDDMSMVYEIDEDGYLQLTYDYAGALYPKIYRMWPIGDGLFTEHQDGDKYQFNMENGEVTSVDMILDYSRYNFIKVTEEN